jgi:sporulation protein YlmC with PRC-barrel domain
VHGSRIVSTVYSGSLITTRPDRTSPQLRRSYVKSIASVIVLALVGSVAAAQSHRAANNGDAIGITPAEQFTVTNYYKRDVYDRSLNFVGTIDDVLIDQRGSITALIIGVGGFFGIGRKNFSEPFGRVQMAKKNDKWYLVMDADNATLKGAPGLKYDHNATTWVPLPQKVQTTLR